MLIWYKFSSWAWNKIRFVVIQIDRERDRNVCWVIGWCGIVRQCSKLIMLLLCRLSIHLCIFYIVISIFITVSVSLSVTHSNFLSYFSTTSYLTFSYLLIQMLHCTTLHCNTTQVIWSAYDILTALYRFISYHFISLYFKLQSNPTKFISHKKLIVKRNFSSALLFCHVNLI